MSYSSSLSDQEWEILEPLLLELLPPKKRTRPPEWTCTRNPEWHPLPTQEWLQLGRLAQRLAPLLNGVLALQAVAGIRGNREVDECFTWASAPTGKKKPKWTRLIIIDSQAVKNTCNASVESKGWKFLQINQWD